VRLLLASSGDAMMMVAVQDIAIGAAVAAASAYVCMRVWRYIRESMREKPPPNVYLQAAIAELRVGSML
jgi:hypothetical protein